MSQAFGFISNKEVVVLPWTKKPDVEITDPSGQFLNIYLDITLPALHQDGPYSRDDIYKQARTAKARDYPRKDSQGRLLNMSACVPFILTSMGGLCSEGHEFLRLCKKRDVEKTFHMMDVLITQHARWAARRIKRALFGQALIDFSTAPWSRIQIVKGTHDSKQQRGINLERNCLPRLARQFSSFPVIGDSHEQRPLVQEDEPVALESDSEESEEELGQASEPESAKVIRETEHFSLSPS